ncbi:tRNA epoxyqueuosine(34) reductase QueG [Candidatus Peregrinibacteria bacterium]|nr:tRNA epoxyqueuosine(34) reductase QueG [Candidatus Peregrinibacteria bacterium]
MRTRNLIENYAKKLGFDLVGFSPAEILPKYKKAYKAWLKNHYDGKMSYMREREKIEKRFDLQKILPGAASVIVLAMNYFRPQKPLKKGCGRIARYAFGRDYHKIIGSKLRELEKFIQTLGGKTKSCVDAGPVLERALAEQAGLGVVGKNSCLITDKFGSWVFLAEIITDLDLAEKDAQDPNNPQNPSKKSNFSSCGQCQRCFQACPTGAIVSPGVIDARKCISYLTIENKEKISQKFAEKIAKTRRIFGCDICQEVCPHNISRQCSADCADLSTPKIAGDQISLRKILSIKTDAEFLKIFAGSPLMRAKRKGLQRNASITCRYIVNL